MLRRFTFAAVLLALPLGGGLLAAQDGAADSSLLTVDRIFASPEFRPASASPLAWLPDGTGYTTFERVTGRQIGRASCRERV